MDICRKTNRQSVGTNQNEFCDTMGLGQFLGPIDYPTIIMKNRFTTNMLCQYKRK